MKKKELLKIVKNPNIIPGIHNYCDRWCERCAFTARCSVYAMEAADHDNAEIHDINNEAFWDNLHNIFEQTLEMVKEMAEERGIDLDEIDLEEEMLRSERRREEADSHEVARSASRYADMVDEWFESEKTLFEEKEGELHTKLDWGVETSQLTSEADDIVDAVEVIRWYQHQIYVKLMRALQQDEFDEIEELEDFPKDSDGSAKVALMGMDRSLTAWGRLRNHFPEKTDDILTILLQLDRLRRRTEREFPEARNFMRPGFDTLNARDAEGH